VGDTEQNWASLLDRLVQGDAIAYAHISRLVTRRLEKVGAFYIQDSWEDLVHEVLISLMKRRRDRPEEEFDSFPAFIHVVVRRRVSGHMRTLGRRPEGSAVSLGPEIEIPGGLSPGESSPELILELASELDRLPDELAHVIVEAYIVDKTNEEIARDSGASRATVVRRRSRGLELLRQSMTPGDKET
jgi:RNA polymerase sigma factor (sigma-70 family)